MLEIKVLGWDQKCSFSMVGELGQDSFGRFVAFGSERVYAPDDALIWVKELPPVVVAPDPVPDPGIISKDVVPVRPEESKKPSRAHEMAMLARKLREQHQKKVAKDEARAKKAAEKLQAKSGHPTSKKTRSPRKSKKSEAPVSAPKDPTEK
jgi:hypothetical protein